MNEGAFRLGIERGRCMPTHFTRGRMAFGLCLLSARSATPNSSAHALYDPPCIRRSSSALATYMRNTLG